MDAAFKIPYMYLRNMTSMTTHMITKSSYVITVFFVTSLTDVGRPRPEKALTNLTAGRTSNLTAGRTCCEW